MPHNLPMNKGFALLALLALLGSQAQAVVVSRITDFEAGTPIVADDMNAELDNIIDALNGNLSGENMVDQAITTGDLAAYSVTKVKLGDFGQQISSSSGVAERSSITPGLIPNMTANLTVSHRPVWVGLQAADGTAAPGSVTYRNNGAGATGNQAFISFQRDLTTVSQSGISTRDITSSTNDTFISLPCSSFWFLDVPGNGPHNYTASYRTATGDDGIIIVENCKLVVFEL
jgi:hypothetical protein